MPIFNNTCPPPLQQVSGAALLTSVLETVPAEDLLAPGKAKQVGTAACSLIGAQWS